MSDQDDSTIEPEDDVVTDPDDDGQGDGDADQLGDAGKKALDAMKAKWRAARDELRDLKAKDAGKKTDDQDPDTIREQARAEARAETLRDRALDKVETKAAKLFADPEDARALLAGRVDDFVDDGQIDVDAINEALTELLKKKPHLAAATAKRFQGGGDGGARKGSKPDQLTRDDLKKMTPQQIVKAQDEGRLNDLMGID
ncbi:hypothetical protein Ait01nite_089540 [Actinoplanes italicus]|uniref:Minor structural protein GP20 n=1 Tax=Actinoplanes italicus TaxID=113567 RepID=A0A2T0JIF9_9ACTN|nr:hypothetical protein [Actinoplanes italicus]PRX07370.1 hypothetical protein CLV67_14245 [Actinoplanes italicus]GIE35909.1 hypothetical protein Ait01nite_089540 [Actinoplanes italicus]